MSWATWDQAAIASALSLIAWLILRALPSGRVRNALMPAFSEFALISALYAVWRLARELPFTHPEGAMDRARAIDDVQNFFHLPTEISMQHFVVHYDWLAALTNDYYATVHVPALLVFLVWLFIRHRDQLSALAQRARRTHGVLPRHPVHPGGSPAVRAGARLRRPVGQARVRCLR